MKAILPTVNYIYRQMIVFIGIRIASPLGAEKRGCRGEHLSARKGRDDRNERKQKEVSKMAMEIAPEPHLVLHPRTWLHGGPWDVWLASEKYVGAFIKANRLTPVPYAFKEPVVRGATTKMSHERAIDIEEITGAYGGMRVPHLHYRGETYLLDTKQWKTFSGEIIEDFSKRLAESKTVNFEQFVELANTMNAII